jgi:hypothetical protein
MTPLEKGNKLSIYEYYYNIIFIYQINNYKLCYLNKLKEFDDVLIIKTNSSKNLFIYNREENCLDFSLKENELNNLYLIGYKAINDYMNSKNEIV